MATANASTPLDLVRQRARSLAEALNQAGPGCNITLEAKDELHAFETQLNDFLAEARYEGNIYEDDPPADPAKVWQSLDTSLDRLKMMADLICSLDANSTL